MIVNQLQEKGILAKILEQGIRILLIKECKKIGNIKIDIITNSTQILKGRIQKINVIADDINYKDLLFDSFELEANHLKINFKLMNKELYFINNPVIKFKILLSQNSLKTVLLSNNWNWIGNMICKEILNQEKLEDIKIRNGQLFIKASKTGIDTNQLEQINIKVEKGKIYLEHKDNGNPFEIPIEDKIHVKSIGIDNNAITIFVNSSISF